MSQLVRAGMLPQFWKLAREGEAEVDAAIANMAMAVSARHPKMLVPRRFLIVACICAILSSCLDPMQICG
jgi:hypothetical protein